MGLDRATPTRLRQLLSALLLSAVLVLVASQGACNAFGAAHPPSRQTLRGSLPVRVECRPAAPYTAYWLGRVFQGLRVSSAATYCEAPGKPAGARAAEFAISYGTCAEGSLLHSAGCVAPLEVQSAPLCERHAALYRDPFTGSELPHKNLRTRGVPAALYHDGNWSLEVYTGRTTVAIFGSRRRAVLRAARRVVPAPRRAVPRLSVELTLLPRGIPRPASPRALRPPSRRILGRHRPC